MSRENIQTNYAHVTKLQRSHLSKIQIKLNLELKETRAFRIVSS